MNMNYGMYSSQSIKASLNMKSALLKTLLTLSVLFPSYALAAVPSISSIAEQSVNKGQTFSFTPRLTSGSNSDVNWSIAYGPDAVQISQGSGTISWDVSSSLPSESFYIGVQASNADGADIEYFIVHVGVPEVVHVGPSYDIKTLGPALRANHPAGTTFVVENGVYSTQESKIGLRGDGVVQMPPGGNSSAYSTVMAQTPGGVEFNNEAKIAIEGGTGNPFYLAVKGFFINGPGFTIVGQTCDGDTSCEPHHIKIEANGVNIKDTQGFGVSYASNILFENNYAFGGLRTKFSFYHVDKVIARRNVARFDWVSDSPGPQNTFSFYSTTNAIAQNNIAVDSDSPYFWQPAEDAGEFGCPVTSGGSQVQFVRNIQLNSAKIWGNMDSQGSNACVADLNNNISWDVRPYAAHIAARGGVDIDHMTIGQIEMLQPDTWLVNGFPQNSRGFRNSIIHDANTTNLFYDFALGITNAILGRTYSRTGIHNINISSTSASINENDGSGNSIDTDSITRLNPIYSLANPQGSLKYILRSEDNTNMSNLDDSNEALGATVTTLKGATGSMWGEGQYNTETGRPAWPFPLQDVIKTRMAQMNYSGAFYAGDGPNKVQVGTAHLSGQRGFATSGKDLTYYVWGYLGNAVPPMNVSAQTDGTDTIVRWDPPASAYKSVITGYKVYDFNPDTKALSNPREVASNQVSLTVENSGGNTSYAVTAMHSSRGESGYSYPSNGSYVASEEEPATGIIDDATQAIQAPVLRILEIVNTTD